MAIYHVLLNGTGSSGNGSTWNDDSSGTAAYIAQAGLSTIYNAAVPGDIIYVKGTDATSSTALELGSSADDATYVDRPVRVLGCKSTTTNTGVSIVTSDLIPGYMTGDTDEAWNDADMPRFFINSSTSDLTIVHGWWYGIRMGAGDNVTLMGSSDNQIHLEECWLEVNGSSDILSLGTVGMGTVTANHSRFLSDGTSLILPGAAHMKFKHCTFDADASRDVFDGSSCRGYAEFDSCIFEGGVTTILALGASNGYYKFFNCQFPAGWALGAGSSTRRYNLENYGGSSATTATTSIQRLQLWDRHGQVNNESTVVRTGGADDGDTGGFSWDMTPVASRTLPGMQGLESPEMMAWVEGDGTSKTATVYFCSDTGNTNTADWQNDEVWLHVSYVSESGNAGYIRGIDRALLLATPADVTDDATSTWGSGGVRGQKLTVSIAPDYHGWIRGTVSFAPDANADTIYVDPAIYIT